MLFTIQEIIDVLVMTLAVGFIFKDVFTRNNLISKIGRDGKYDPLAQFKKYRKSSTGFFNLQNSFFFAIIVTAPAIIFHELGHKLVAIGFGLEAVFHAAYFWLGLGILLKLLSFGFIFFVPAYVSISGAGITPLAHSMVAFAGPLVNLILFGITTFLLKQPKFMSKYKKYTQVLVLTSRINLFLFIFNMLPIPMFDGWQVYSGLIQTIF